MNYYIEKMYLKWLRSTDSKDHCKMRAYIEKNYGIKIGKYTYGYNFRDIAKGTQIGAFCSIAPGVKIGLMNHPMNYVSSHPFLYYANRGFCASDREFTQKEPAIVEDDVWIGTNAVILPGVRLGKGAVIGAGAVVTKNIPPYAIAGGVMAKVIKFRFSQDIIGKLLEIDWASWDDEQIRRSLGLFYDPEKFIERFERGLL